MLRFKNNKDLFVVVYNGNHIERTKISSSNFTSELVKLIQPPFNFQQLDEIEVIIDDDIFCVYFGRYANNSKYNSKLKSRNPVLLLQDLNNNGNTVFKLIFNTVVIVKQENYDGEHHSVSIENTDFHSLIYFIAKNEELVRHLSYYETVQ